MMKFLSPRAMAPGVMAHRERPLADKVSLCAAALVEARQLSAARMFGSLHAQLEQRIEEMLDELDSMLRTVDAPARHEADALVASLREGYAELLARRDQLGT